MTALPGPTSALLTRAQQKAKRVLDAAALARPNRFISAASVEGLPTFVWSASGGNSAITSQTTYRPQNLVNGLPAFENLSGGLRFAVGSGTYPVGNYQCDTNRVGFRIRTNAPQVAIYVRNLGDGTYPSQITIRVNGEWLTQGSGAQAGLPIASTPTAITANGDGAFYWGTLSFVDTGSNTVAIDRAIDFFANGQAQIAAYQITSGYNLYPADLTQRTCQVAILGDSYTDGVGPLHKANSVAGRVHEALGWHSDVVARGVGGMGYTVPGTGTSFVGVQTIPNLTRLGIDPDAVLVALGINDAGQTVSQLQAGVTAFWQAMLAAFPGVPLINVGCYRGSTGQKDPGITLANAEVASFQAVTAGVPWCFHLQAYQNGFQNPATTANYASDGLHPSDLGGDSLGRLFIVPAMVAQLNAFV